MVTYRFHNAIGQFFLIGSLVTILLDLFINTPNQVFSLKL
ncbi:hypothetical protein BSM4216_1229 [Bacillus smithii]|nr:hypothetical protein BSM4216_1229 [Bacillus smithii]